MERQDHGLAFLLRYENIAWYEEGRVTILNRQVYPERVEFVTCRTHREVAQALADMVTQSGGPYTAVPMGMALAAWECRDRRGGDRLAYLREAAHTLAHARPTTAKRMERLCESCLEAAAQALDRGEDLPQAIVDRCVEMNDQRYAMFARIGDYLTDLFPQNPTVLTHCYGETIVGMMLRSCREKGKVPRVFCSETRPYFQGARLTATVCRDMGADVTVITDSMAAWVMDREKVDLFTTAADCICMDGHVVNKVGTFQHAVTARYFGVPYFVTGTPDPGHPTGASVPIEMRDPELALLAMGKRVAAQGVKGYYPAFDVTPPHLVSGVVTDRGVFSPYDLRRYGESERMVL